MILSFSLLKQVYKTLPTITTKNICKYWLIYKLKIRYVNYVSLNLSTLPHPCGSGTENSGKHFLTKKTFFLANDYKDVTVNLYDIRICIYITSRRRCFARVVVSKKNLSDRTTRFMHCFILICFPNFFQMYAF